jgi:predicted naringenin-chalcone synthase
MSFAIRGVGVALPETRITQDESVQAARTVCRPPPEQQARLAVLYRLTGIETRHLAMAPEVVQDVLNGTSTSGSVFLPHGDDTHRGPTTGERLEHYARKAGPLALQAARQALGRAELPGGRVTHLVTVSCTGFRAPGVDRELIEGLGLPARVERTHVGFMGCHGALNGLRVGRAFTGSDAGACVLVCAVELCSIHFHYGWDPQKTVANALFGDGAAAVVGTAALPGESAWRVTATGSCLCPDSADAMTWTVGDHGFEMTLSPRVPELIGQHLRPWLRDWLAGNGLTLEQVASWAVHPGGPRILRAIEKSLGLAQEATAVSREVLAECGNISSPTVLFILERLQRRQAPRPCVALAFGPGLTAEAVLFS